MRNNTEIDITPEAEEKSLTAKNGSKGAMAFSSVWIAVLTILRGLKIIELEITDIVYSGLAIVGVWSPTFLSIWLDKIKAIRFGGAE